MIDEMVVEDESSPTMFAFVVGWMVTHAIKQRETAESSVQRACCSDDPN